MSKEKLKVKWKNGSPETTVGNVNDCIEFAKRFRESAKDLDPKQENNNLQEERMFALNDEDKAIIKTVLELYKKNGEYPTIIKIRMNMPNKYQNQPHHYPARKIKDKLSKFLSFSGKYKGKRVCPTEEFLSNNPINK